jgi:hypothetical protein
MDTLTPDSQSRWFWPVLILIALAHVVIANWAASGKSATVDEPLHLVGSLMQLRTGDARAAHDVTACRLAGCACGTNGSRRSIEPLAPREILDGTTYLFDWPMQAR